MKYQAFIICIVAILLTGCATSLNKKVDSSDYTIYLVRHCKKADDGTKDPPLTKKGALLNSKGIEEIYTSDYLRTKGTGQPLATALGLEMVVYNPRELQQVGAELKSKKKTVLVVGHSNSTPSLANVILGHEAYERFDESQYDQIIEIHFKGNSTSHSISDF